MKYFKPNLTQSQLFTANFDYVHVQIADTYLGLMTSAPRSNYRL